MNSKSRINARIQALQSKAAAICRRCAHREAPNCRGPRCEDILRVVDEIDPLISEYLRLDLAEMHQRGETVKEAPFTVWQRLLPLSASSARVAAARSSTPSWEEIELAPQEDADGVTAVPLGPPALVDAVQVLLTLFPHGEGPVTDAVTKRRSRPDRAGR